MTNAAAATALISLVSLFLFVLGYFRVYRVARLDHYRQSLFDIRNGAWEYARKRDLLNTPAHGRVRDLLNGLIRLAPITNTLTWIPLLFLAPAPSQPESTTADIAALPEISDRVVFSEARTRAIYLTFLYLLGPAYLLHAFFDEDYRFLRFLRAYVARPRKIEARVESQARDAAKHPLLYADPTHPEPILARRIA
jgi:hypothetical protein